jgi:hypothetical protein
MPGTKVRRVRAALLQSKAITELLKLLNGLDTYADPAWDGFRLERLEDLAFMQRGDRAANRPSGGSSHNAISIRAEVGIIVAGIEHVIAKSFRDARRTPDHKERALHRRIALDAFERLSALYQALGLVQRRDFAVPDDDGKAVGRFRVARSYSNFSATCR